MPIVSGKEMGTSGCDGKCPHLIYHLPNMKRSNHNSALILQNCNKFNRDYTTGVAHVCLYTFPSTTPDRLELVISFFFSSNNLTAQSFTKSYRYYLHKHHTLSCTITLPIYTQRKLHLLKQRPWCAPTDSNCLE